MPKTTKEKIKQSPHALEWGDNAVGMVPLQSAPLQTQHHPDPQRLRPPLKWTG